MTERKEAEEKLKQLAHYDQLTGLPNRVTLRSELSELLSPTDGSEWQAGRIAVAAKVVVIDCIRPASPTSVNSAR
jgi:GGDEF domain-containing protein